MSKDKVFLSIKTIVFFVIMLFVILSPKNMFDVIFSDMFISLFGKTFLVYFFKLISYIFHDKILLLIMGIAGLALLWLKEYRKSLFILSTAFFGAVITLGLKGIIARQRPLFEEFTGGSFPSGHSVVVVLFFLSLLFIINKNDKLELFAKVAMILVPFSRIAIGAHYPTDVIAGVLLASIVVDCMKILNPYFLMLFRKGLLKNDKK